MGINPLCIVLFSLYVLTSLEEAKVTYVWDALEKGRVTGILERRKMWNKVIRMNYRNEVLSTKS